jgi:hypothetical protein
MSLVRGSENVLCPREIGPNKHPLHALHDRLNDASYEAAERVGGLGEDADELTEAAERQHGAVSYGKDNAYGMRAYVARVAGIADGFGLVDVRAAWLECQVCGLILPGEYRTTAERPQGKW